MDKSKFGTLFTLIQLIERNKAMNNTPSNVMREVYDEFSNFLTENQKAELKELYSL